MDTMICLGRKVTQQQSSAMKSSYKVSNNNDATNNNGASRRPKPRNSNSYEYTDEQAYPSEVLNNSVSGGGRRAPSALKPDSLDYLDTSEILPMQASSTAKSEMSRIMIGLDTHEWPEIFHTLNVVRQLVLHHPKIITSHSRTALHDMYMGVLRQADNLRSQVAKNAILTIGDMYIGFGKMIDGEVASSVQLLTKKTADNATTFVASTAESTICKIIENSSANRCLNALLNCTDSRNPTLRGRVAGFLHLLVSMRSSELKNTREIDILKGKLKNMLHDNTPDARAFTRDIVRELINKGTVSKAELEQKCTPELVAKALSMPTHSGNMSPMRSSGRMTPARQSKLMSPGGNSAQNRTPKRNGIPPSAQESDYDGPGGMPLTVASDGDDEAHFTRNNYTNYDDNDDELDNSASGMLLGGTGTNNSGSGSKKKKMRRKPKNTSTHTDPLESSNDMSGNTPSRSKANAAKRIMDSNEDLLSLPDYYVKLSSNQWTDRRDALTKVTDIVIKYVTVLRDASKLNHCLDRILDKLDDGSIKVVLHSLSCIHRLHVEVPTLLCSIQNVVQPALLSVASSSNRQVSSAANPILKEVLNSFPLQLVIEHLCSTALYDKDRLRVMALRLLKDSISRCCQVNGNSNESITASSSIACKKLIFPTLCLTFFPDSNIKYGAKNGFNGIKSNTNGITVVTSGEVRVAASDVLKELQRNVTMGDKVAEWCEDITQQNEIKRILRS